MSEKNGRKSFMIYFNLGAMVAYMSDEEAGKLFKGIIDYADSRKEPDFKGNQLLQMVFENFRQTEDDNLAKWLDKREKRSRSGMISALKRQFPDKSKDELGKIADGLLEGKKNAETEPDDDFHGITIDNTLADIDNEAIEKIEQDLPWS